MFKKLMAALLLFVITAGSVCAFPAEVRADEDKLLVIYCGDMEGDSGTLTSLIKPLFYRNMDFTVTALEDISEDTLSGFTAAVIFSEAEENYEEKAALISESGLPVFFIGCGEELSYFAKTKYYSGSVMVTLTTTDSAQSSVPTELDGAYMLSGEGEDLEAGTVYIGGSELPLCKSCGDVTQFAVYDAGFEIMQAALINALVSFLWPYENEPTAYANYLVLQDVYPFYDLTKLMELTDMLDEADVPYCVCVMPIYENGDYPAFKRFCEWLRYVQSNGTGIVMRTPLVSLEGTDEDDILEHMVTAWEAYASYGVYPVALACPEAYITSLKGLTLLQGFRTLFLFESDDDLSDAALDTNMARAAGHQIIAPAYSSYDAFTTAYAQGIWLDVNEDIDTIGTYVERLKNSRVVLKGLTGMTQSVYIGSHYLTVSTEGVLALDGGVQDLSYTPFVYEEYTYDRGFVQYLTEQIQTSNKWITIFAVVSIAFFVTAIILARKAMREELLHGKKKKKK